MSYVQNNLTPGERILYSTRLHWIVLARPIMFDAIFCFFGLYMFYLALQPHSAKLDSQMVTIVGLALILVGSGMLGIAVLRRNATEMAVTNKRIIIKVGFFTKRTVELFLGKVESVGVEQSLLARLLGYGSIVVRGTGGTNEPFMHVANPLEFRRQVQHQIEEHIKSPADTQ